MRVRSHTGSQGRWGALAPEKGLANSMQPRSVCEHAPTQALKDACVTWHQRYTGHTRVELRAQADVLSASGWNLEHRLCLSVTCLTPMSPTTLPHATKQHLSGSAAPYTASISLLVQALLRLAKTQQRQEQWYGRAHHDHAPSTSSLAGHHSAASELVGGSNTGSINRAHPYQAATGRLSGAHAALLPTCACWPSPMHVMRRQLLCFLPSLVSPACTRFAQADPLPAGPLTVTLNLITEATPRSMLRSCLAAPQGAPHALALGCPHPTLCFVAGRQHQAVRRGRRLQLIVLSQQHRHVGQRGDLAHGKKVGGR
eukprot:364446-Chlamydomonas_euryale.AAC.2